MTSTSEPDGAPQALLQDPRVTALLDASVDATVVLDERADLAWASPATQELLGWSLGELREMGALALVHPDDLDEGARQLSLLLSGGADDEPPVVLRLRRRDDDPLWVEIKGTDLRSVAGVDGTLLSARDISHRLELEAALQASQRRVEALVRNSNDAILVLGPRMRITYASPAVELLSGYRVEAILGHEVHTVVEEPGRSELLAVFEDVQRTPGSVGSVRVRIRHRDGGSRWLEIRVSNHLDDPAVLGMIANARDVTDVVEAEVAAASLTEIFDLTDDLVTVVDGDSNLLYMNRACQDFFGLSDAELAGRLGSLWRVGEVGDAMREPGSASGRARFERGERSWSDDVVLRSADGREVHHNVQVIAHTDAEGRIVRFSAIGRDVSESKQLAASLERQATHDALTGLPNRSMIEDRLRERERSADSGPTALLFLDLDRFKVINDSLGHDVGDRLLRVVAARLADVVRPGDTVARFGGDEFVVLCEDVEDVTAANEVARRLLEALAAPVEVDGHQLRVSASIGIAVLDRADPLDPVGLVRDADTAMYRAKADGRNRSVVFDEALRRRAVDRHRTESALATAMHDGSLEVHYQPTVHLGTGRLVALEALVRWRQGDQLVAPSDFVPLAEESGLIVPLGEWVLDRACADLARWQRIPGWHSLGLAVNTSVRQLQHSDFVQTVADALARHGLDGRSLMVEITESVFLDDHVLHTARLERLRELRCGVAIDDFGTGYSSLTYMSRLPVDVVKLDRSFLRGVGEEPHGEGSTLVAAVLELVRALGFRSVAEGIESQAQLDELARLGCDAGQGYHLARPMVAAEVGSCLRGLAADHEFRTAGLQPAGR